METEEAQELAQMAGRDSPAPEEEEEEPMAVPEDLSAGAAHQQNHREDKGTRHGLTGPTRTPEHQNTRTLEHQNIRTPEHQNTRTLEH
ncbi:DNA-binding protein Ikaros [Liparis tanakae]|uniref:DNA-binding protein Ikaros n=1 Tax=Liparis tanakae TaxID=230148 RepID=A0A4Z2E4H3_9TELE|nr:DNA-binding protein Ikaros [Liparis tanakae]